MPGRTQHLVAYLFNKNKHLRAQNFYHNESLALNYHLSSTSSDYHAAHDWQALSALWRGAIYKHKMQSLHHFLHHSIGGWR